jgi:AcrR family transcriptional regulator
MGAPSISSTPVARRADAARNRAALLDAARRVLARRGLEVTVEELARGAGVGVGTVYRNFPTKDALVAAVIERAFEELTAAAEAALDDPDPGESFFTLVRGCAATMARDVVLVRAARAADRANEPRPEHVRRLFDATDAVLARAIAAGAVRDGVTAEDVAALLVGIGEAANHPREATENALDRYVTIVIDGLKPPTC